MLLKRPSNNDRSSILRQESEEVASKITANALEDQCSTVLSVLAACVMGEGKRTRSNFVFVDNGFYIRSE